MKVLALVLLLLTGQAVAQSPIYATWAPWQADSVLAAWALKRFVVPQAHFEALPKGTSITPERSLDTPQSPYRRSGTRTAYDEVLRVHGIRSDCAERFRPLVKVLELAPWRKAEHPEAEAFESALVPLLPSDNGEGGLERAFEFLDRQCTSGKGSG